MSFLQSLKGQNFTVIMAYIFITIANYCSFFAMATTGWGIVDGTNDDDTVYGLWRRCQTKTVNACIALDGYGKTWYQAVQGSAVFGFASIAIAWIVLSLFIYKAEFKRSRAAAIWVICAAIVGVLGWLVAVIVFGVKFEDDEDLTGSNGDSLGISFACACIASGCAAVTAVLMIVGFNISGVVHASE